MKRYSVLLLLLFAGCASTASTDYASRTNSGVLGETIVMPPKDETELMLNESVDRLFVNVPEYRPYKEDIGKVVQYPKVVHVEHPVHPFRPGPHNGTTTIML